MSFSSSSLLICYLCITIMSNLLYSGDRFCRKLDNWSSRKPTSCSGYPWLRCSLWTCQDCLDVRWSWQYMSIWHISRWTGEQFFWWIAGERWWVCTKHRQIRQCLPMLVANESSLAVVPNISFWNASLSISFIVQLVILTFRFPFECKKCASKFPEMSFFLYFCICYICTQVFTVILKGPPGRF